MDCVFCKVIAHELPSKVVFENEKLVAIHDIHPAAPVHILVLPKEHIADFTQAKDQDLLILFMQTIQTIITEQNLHGVGYRIIVNGGGAAQVDHLHFHIIGHITKTRKV